MPAACRRIAELRVNDLRALNTDTIAEAVAKVLAIEALCGKVNAAKELSDRAEGTPTQRHEITGDEGGEVKIRTTNDELVIALKRIYNLA